MILIFFFILITCLIDIVLILYRYCIDIVLILYWYCIDIVLILYWYCIDIVLILYWYCIDIVREILTIGFPYLVTTQTFSSAFSNSLPEPFAFLPEEKLHAHVFEGKASCQSNTHVLTFRGWFLYVLFPVSQPVHQLSHVALITLLTNNLLHCTRPIFVYP